jgi:putative ABC transport system substrate-binding protein
MRRRELLALMGVAVAWPLAAQSAERAKRLGVLMSNKEGDPVAVTRVAKFREGLAQLGWHDGQNLQIEWRWAGGDIVLTRRYAEQLVQLAPDILLGNGTPATVALKQATTTIPIVFSVVNDPVSQGIISSMAHPGGNITGFSFLEYSMVGKSLEMLKRIAPQSTSVAIMFNPETYPY